MVTLFNFVHVEFPIESFDEHVLLEISTFSVSLSSLFSRQCLLFS